jgi:transcriptional repressor NrdR
MMKCPYCSDETKVIDKRDVEGTVKRRRECVKCEKRFTTFEKPELTLTIIKKDGSKQDYDREKILNGILKACEKRPIEKETLEAMVDEIEAKLMCMGPEVETKKIGEIVMKKLKKLDEVAYIRFASVCRSFDDITSFEKEVKALKG